MRDVLGFWSYALAACAFASVTLWRLRARLTEAWWWLGAAGVASLALGLFLAVAPAVGAVRIVWWIGWHAVVSGALLLVLGLRLRARRVTGLASAAGGDARAPRALHEGAHGARVS